LLFLRVRCPPGAPPYWAPGRGPARRHRRPLCRLCRLRAGHRRATADQQVSGLTAGRAARIRRRWRTGWAGASG